jgi:uncharacterized protein YqhQ
MVVYLSNKTTAAMTTRNSIIAEIEAIEKGILNLNLSCDQYGNHEQTPKFIELSDKLDELMEMLRSFPI